MNTWQKKSISQKRMIGILRRAFLNLDELMFKRLYTTMVGLIWNMLVPCRVHIKLRTEITENAQRRTTKIISQKKMTYKERIRKLNLPTLT